MKNVNARARVFRLEGGWNAAQQRHFPLARDRKLISPDRGFPMRDVRHTLAAALPWNMYGTTRVRVFGWTARIDFLVVIPQHHPYIFNYHEYCLFPFN